MIGRRSHARRYAVLALYQWQVTGLDPVEICRHFFDDPAWMDVVADALGELDEDRKSAEAARSAYDLALFQELLRGVPEQLGELDAQLESVLDRPIRLVTPVDLAVLRMAVYELINSPEIHSRVVLNEAVELAKEFGSSDDSHRYVNGVLDKIARKLRAAELTGGTAPGRGSNP